MWRTELLELEKLLEIISSDKICGDDISETRDFIQIKKQVKKLINEDKHQYQQQSNVTEWKTVKKKCIELLTDQSKDLYLVVWLTYACFKIDRIEGLTHGIYLLSDYIGRYWQCLYPEIDDNNIENRIRPLKTLTSDNFLIYSIGQTIITDCSKINYSYIEKKDQSKTLKSDKNLIYAFENTDVEFANHLVDKIETCLDALFYFNKCILSCYKELKVLEKLERYLEELIKSIQSIYNLDKKNENISDVDTSFIENSEQKSKRIVSAPKNIDIFNSIITHRLNSVDIIQYFKDSFISIDHAINEIQLRIIKTSVKRDIIHYKYILAKLCMEYSKKFVARKLLEEIYRTIEECKLEEWEEPFWLADIFETYHLCITEIIKDDKKPDKEDIKLRNRLFNKICSIDIARAIRIDHNL